MQRLLQPKPLRYSKTQASMPNRRRRSQRRFDEKIPLKASYPDEVNIRLIERDLYDSFDSLIPLYKHGSKPLKESIASEVESRPDDFAEIALPDDLETRLMQSPRKESRADLVDLAARRIRALGRKGNRLARNQYFRRRV